MEQRIIKFRGKHIESGEWLYGSHYDDCGEEYILPCMPGSATDYEDYQVDPNTVGQYTGLTDKYGNGVYEGDIVKRHCNAYGLDNIGVVKYDDEKARFVLYCKERHYAKSLLFMKQQTINDGQCTIEETFTYEIIGNIHDNSKFKEG